MGDNEERSRDRERSRRDRPSRFSESSRERSPGRGKERGGMKSSHCRVYISNIPYEYRWQDLKDLFRGQVGDVSFVELFVDQNDKPRGCGIVEFADSELVKKCLEVMHRFELQGRKIVIKEDFGNRRDKYGNLVGSAGINRARDREENRDHRQPEDCRSGFNLGQGSLTNNQGGGESQWGNTYGLSPQFLESLWINTSLINRVFVANLDYKVNKKKIKEVFRLAGKVRRVDLSVDKDGNSRGFAVVEYDHPVEAVQAISMLHNQQLYDRTITVRMDRESDRQNIKLPDGLKAIGMGLGSRGEPLRDVACHVPSISKSTSLQAAVNTSYGSILGPVPTINLPVGVNSAAAALNSLNNAVSSSAFSNLNTNAAVLQAVEGLSNNLLGGNLGNGELGFTASLLNNPLMQQQSLATLGANTGNLTNNSNSGIGGFSRNDSNHSYMGGTQNASFQSGVLQQQAENLMRGGRNQHSRYDDSPKGFRTNDRDSRGSSNNLYNSNINNIRSSASLSGATKSLFSNKVLISNLPPTASFNMLSDKCSEYGEVKHVDDNGSGSVIVTYQTQCDAERAIKNMDHARIDGRTIDVRFLG